MPAPSRLTAEISVPETVHLPSDRRKAALKVDVLCRLHNDGGDAYVVGSEDLDDAHHWHVLSESHREVMRIPSPRRKRRFRKSRDSDVHPFVSQMVAGGHSHHTSHTLLLDARKLKPGKTYTVRYEYHGHVAEAYFTTVPGHSAPPRRKKRKAPTRKRTRNAPARTTKTTARKKTTTRKKKS